jgi:uncharacterized membrane protein SirB2
MNTGTLLSTLIVLHLTGLIIMAGTTLVDYTLFKTFWKQFEQDKEKAIGILQAATKFSRLIGIGAALLILTGIGMMALTNGIFGEQLWFRIKFALVILLILNGTLIGRRQALKFRKFYLDDNIDTTGQAKRFKTRLNTFYFVQLAIFLTIIFLSVFKFN